MNGFSTYKGLFFKKDCEEYMTSLVVTHKTKNMSNSLTAKFNDACTKTVQLK